MSDEIILKEVEVQKLRLRPGDVVLVHLPPDTRHSWMQKLALHFHKLLPRNPTILVANDIKVTIASPEDAKEIVKSMKEAPRASKPQQ